MRNLMLLVRKDLLSALMTPSALITTGLLAIFLISVNTALVFVLVIYMLVINLFAYDENDLVCNVTGILPIRMEEAVLARYVYAWLLLLVTTIVGGGISFVTNTFITQNESSWLPSLLFALSSALLMMSIIMPLNYKLGTVRARIASMIVYILMVAISTAVSTLFTMRVSDASESAMQVLMNPVASVAWVAVLATALLSAVSLFISLKIKKN